MQTAESLRTDDAARPMFKYELTDEVTITPAAHRQLKALVSDEEDIEGVRIFVQGGGCGGMGYSMTFATERFHHDAVFEQEGLKIFVDAVALNFLEGVEIDYVEHATGASFVFNNVFQALGGGGGCPTCGASSGGGCG
jgi:iron-sulfur cluster assembly accessory protein